MHPFPGMHYKRVPDWWNSQAQFVSEYGKSETRNSRSFDRDQVIKDILLELFRMHEQPVAFGYNPSEAVVIDVLFGESVNSVITKL
jgi:hypothetical protein